MASVLEEYLNERSKNALVKICSAVETCDRVSVCTLNIPNTLLCLWYRQKLSEDDIIRELNKATQTTVLHSMSPMKSMHNTCMMFK